MKPEQQKAGTGGSKEDYSLAGMEAAFVKANNGRPLTDKQRSEVRFHFEKIEAARKKVEDCEAARLNAECEHYLELMQDEILAEDEARIIGSERHSASMGPKPPEAKERKGCLLLCAIVPLLVGGCIAYTYRNTEGGTSHTSN